MKKFVDPEIDYFKKNEVWLKILDFPDYEVSCWGRVRSNKFGKTSILKPVKNKAGYLRVNLWKNGERKNKFVHQLVMNTFYPNWLGYDQINHIDENKENNRLDNLEYMTAWQNTNYGTRSERMAKSKSKPVLQYSKDGEFIKEWSSTIEITRQTGFLCSHICECCNGKIKSASGFIWKYKG